MRRGFTLVELLVVLGVMVILMAIVIVPIKSMTRNNAQKQAVNQIRAMITTARGNAISHARSGGVVFFEDPAFPNQTAMQFITTDDNQAKYNTLNTVYIHASRDRQYLPRGVQVALLSDDAAVSVTTGGANVTALRGRVVLFDSRGQLILHDGVAVPNQATPADGQYPAAYLDWKLPAHDDLGTDPVTGQPAPSKKGISSPGVLVFNLNDYNAQGFTTANQAAASQWILQHADVMIINGQTGNFLH